MFKFTFVFGLLVCIANCEQLPSFIQRCKTSDSACLIASTNKAIQVLLDGYKPFDIPSFNPFKFERIDLATRANLKLTLTNGNVNKLQSLKIINASISSDWKKWSFNYVFTSAIYLDADYEASGVVVIFPVDGKGKCYLECAKAEGDHIMYFNITEKEGKKYLEQIRDDITFAMDGVRIHIDNLFQGNKALGDQTNALINENWQEVEREFHSGIIALLSYAFEIAFRPFTEKVPLDEMILKSASP